MIAPQSASGVLLDTPESSKLLSSVAIALSNCARCDFLASNTVLALASSNETRIVHCFFELIPNRLPITLKSWKSKLIEMCCP